MTALIIASLLGQVPPEVLTLPRAVLVTTENCLPCERMKRDFAQWEKRKDVRYDVVDMADWNKAVGDGLKVAAAPVLFLWADPEKPGRRFDGAVITREQAEAILGITREDTERWMGSSLGRQQTLEVRGTRQRSSVFWSRRLLRLRGR